MQPTSTIETGNNEDTVAGKDARLAEGGRRSTPPFRADHVGSLLRPVELIAARSAYAEGRIDAQALREVEDRAIRAVVALQEELGFSAVTDGEFRRTTWHMDFIYQLGGIATSEETIEIAFKGEQGSTSFSTPGLRLTERVHLDHTIFEADFRFLQSVATTSMPKLTIPSPSMVHYRAGSGIVDPAVYRDVEAFEADLSSTYAQEIRNLDVLGCRYLQLDDTALAYLNDPEQRAMLAQRGDDPEVQHLRYISQLNAALRGRPATMAVTMHLCRGNYRSFWAAEGGYDFVAEALFNELEVDGFFLEYDDARSGDFRPLRFLPSDKMVVLGLVSTKRGALETKDALKARIDEASRYVPLEQICLSPQCGTSSTADGNALSMEEQAAKLRLVVETADELWG